MQEHCAQCLTVVPPDLGYETPSKEILCGPCYFALWGPRGALALSRSSEAQRPDTRRPARGRPVWIPGPTGELDPHAPKERGRLRGLLGRRAG